MDVVLVCFIRINSAVRISFVPSRPICCVFVSEASSGFLCIAFFCVLYMCTRCVLEVVLVSNKILHYPALRKYHTSTLENAINPINYLHNRSAEPIKFLNNSWLHRRTVRTIGSNTPLSSMDCPPVKMFGHRNHLSIFSDVRTTIIFERPNRYK